MVGAGGVWWGVEVWWYGVGSDWEELQFQHTHNNNTGKQMSEKGRKVGERGMIFFMGFGELLIVSYMGYNVAMREEAKKHATITYVHAAVLPRCAHGNIAAMPTCI